MTYVIAAAGTGGHVFPGLAVGEALVDHGAAKEDVLFVGGDRLEAAVYPQRGFPFLQLEIRGLSRSLSMENLSLPALIWRARKRIGDEIAERDVDAMLAMGGYVTIPAAMAARRWAVPLMVAEQNAGAGLANRIASRWSVRSFASFPDTTGLADAEWVGNPVRRELAEFDRALLRQEALDRHSLAADTPVLGVLGGSLGAGALNGAVTQMMEVWSGPPVQVLHLTGPAHHQKLAAHTSPPSITWRRVGFEDRIELFYAASDLVVARAGGGVAELTATSTPSVLVPGSFGSAGHQAANAAFLARVGAGIVLPEPELDRLAEVIEELLFDRARLVEMSGACDAVSHPEAAETIARAMMEA